MCEYKTPNRKLETSREYQRKLRMLTAYYRSLDPLELVRHVKRKYYGVDEDVSTIRKT